MPPLEYTILAQSQKPLYLALLLEPCSICSKHLIRSTGALINAVQKPDNMPALNNCPYVSLSTSVGEPCVCNRTPSPYPAKQTAFTGIAPFE